MLQINREGVYTNAHPFINERKGETMIPDKDRVPLSGREYYALRELFGMVSSFNKCAGDLEKRVKTVPGAWRDYRLLMVLSEKLMQKVLDTIPKKKLLQIRRDLSHTTCEIKVGMDVSGRRAEGFCYVPDDALVNTVERVINWECLFCEKRGSSVKQCPIRKDLEALYPWDFPLKGETCPLAQMSLERTEDE